MQRKVLPWELKLYIFKDKNTVWFFQKNTIKPNIFCSASSQIVFEHFFYVLDLSFTSFSQLITFKVWRKFDAIKHGFFTLKLQRKIEVFDPCTTF